MAPCSGATVTACGKTAISPVLLACDLSRPSSTSSVRFESERLVTLGGGSNQSRDLRRGNGADDEGARSNAAGHGRQAEMVAFVFI
jgi:hypothetical protein